MKIHQHGRRIVSANTDEDIICTDEDDDIIFANEELPSLTKMKSSFLSIIDLKVATEVTENYNQGNKTPNLTKQFAELRLSVD